MSTPLTDHDLVVATPENVSFGYALAGLGSRFMAALVDSLLIVLLQVLVLGLTVALAFRDLSASSELLGWTSLVLGLVGFVLLWGYYIFFELLWNGQTPGKRWVGLRVLRPNGQPITIVEVLIRNLVRLVDFLPAAYGAGIVCMFIDARARRLGDLAAGTMVVWERSALSVDALVETVAESPVVVAPATGESWSPTDQVLAAEFLDRRAALPNRAELGRKILTMLHTQTGRPLPDVQTVDEVEAALASIARRDEDGAVAPSQA